MPTPVARRPASTAASSTTRPSSLAGTTPCPRRPPPIERMKGRGKHLRAASRNGCRVSPPLSPSNRATAPNPSGEPQSNLAVGISSRLPICAPANSSSSATPFYPSMLNGLDCPPNTHLSQSLHQLNQATLTQDPPYDAGWSHPGNQTRPKGLSGSSACRWYINEDLPEMNAFRASLPEGLGPVTAHIPGEQAMVPAPVREAPVEMSVQELLALDPFDNLKKQFMVKVVITSLGSDNRWWFLSCRKCHKTAYTSGWQYRCSDHTCPSIAADPSYCVCTFGSDGAAEAEFMFFDRAAKSVVGKPLMTLIQRKYPGFTSALDLAQIGGGDVGLPVEISRLITQKYRLVVSISTKSFQPASTQLSFQVSRIDETFKPELAPLGFGGASRTSGASSSAESSGTAVPIPPLSLPDHLHLKYYLSMR